MRFTEQSFIFHIAVDYYCNCYYIYHDLASKDVKVSTRNSHNLVSFSSIRTYIKDLHEKSQARNFVKSFMNLSYLSFCGKRKTFFNLIF